jgi:hypothetical protein
MQFLLKQVDMPSKKDAANLAANRLAAALDDSPQGKGSPPPVGLIALIHGFRYWISVKMN